MGEGSPWQSLQMIKFVQTSLGDCCTRRVGCWGCPATITQGGGLKFFNELLHLLSTGTWKTPAHWSGTLRHNMSNGKTPRVVFEFEIRENQESVFVFRGGLVGIELKEFESHTGCA